MPAKTKKVTLQDVADLAGVSLKTASNVKNEWPYISDETRAKVKSAMQELGYRPSHIARSLATGRSDTIGVIVPDISNPFFSSAFRGCEDTLSAQGYSAYLCNTDEDLEKEKYYLNLMVEQGVDALIVWGSRLETSDIDPSLLDGVPAVFVDGLAQSGPENVSFIQVENYQGACTAIKHLIENGRRNIAHISGAQKRLPARQRLAGYVDTLQSNGLPINENLIVESWPSIGGGYSAAIQLFEKSKPDAVFCYNDLIAIGVLTAANELGLKIPTDLAIVGFDDILPASLVSPMLTTVSIAQYELGCFAANQILQQIVQTPPSASPVSFPVELVVRESCGAKKFSPDERRQLLKKIAFSPSANISKQGIY
jgi:LacI family transcriptional regulator